MTRTVAALVVAVLLVFFASAVHGSMTKPYTPHVAPTEDSPGWDCHTQGNRVCGKR